MISVLFATHNGAVTLPLMLRSLVELDPVDYEVIAVDNASNDDTPGVLEAFKASLPLKVLQQPKRGKNASLNLGLAACGGELIVLTDDDIIADRNWLTTFQACAEGHPDVDLFGGTIAAHWTTPPTSSLLDAVNIAMMFGMTPSNVCDGPVSPLNIWGANMMVRRRVFDAGHRFDESIGPSDGQYIMGSESEFNTRIEKNGYKNWFCTGARVEHIIRKHQVTAEWVIQRSFRYGRSQCVQDAMAEIEAGERHAATVLSIPRWILRKTGEHALGAAWARLRNDEVSYIRNRCDYMFYRGYIHQALQRPKHTNAEGSVA